MGDPHGIYVPHYNPEQSLPSLKTVASSLSNPALSRYSAEKIPRD
jgi:hypothetical protein